MELQPFYDMQKELDEDIITNHNLEGESLTDLKLIAYKVELCELLNEIRSFKFWSNKPPSEDTVILEELVDGWHFLISIGNDKNYNNFINTLSGEGLDKLSYTDLSLALINNELRCSADYMRAIMYTLGLAKKLGFTEPDIFNAYVLKNAENFRRQATGY